MERRGWPWKKKITEKIASAALEFKQSNEQLDSRIDLKDQPAGMTPLQQAEARLRVLTEQLAAKDEAVLQHAKVAEEAVSGWEIAESETASVRQQLDAETQKRLATEDRVSHLDGALKECMRQLRHVREQQEQKIHETVVKKTREWEGVREEMEAKVAKMANELLESEAEKVAMGKSLQERAKAIKEAKEGRSRAEEEVKLLQVRLELAEKEQTKRKYELHVLSKELEIRNEELEYNKKASEVANKQHLENVKKVAKLETECQRLRLLVRKKLPGPAAVAQMKMEVEALGMVPSMPMERGRRTSPLRRNQTNAWKPDRGGTPWMMAGDANGEHLLAMADENKALKEALSKSNSELQAARLLCARTASKLSSVEEQLEDASTMSSYHGLPRSKRSTFDGFVGSAHVGSSQEPSVASVSEDGAPEDESNCAESWASALISELAQFSKKEKGSSISDTMLDSSSCDLMDDFAEMEKLASMPPADSHTTTGLAATAGQEHSGILEAQINSNAALPTLDEKLQSMSRLCDDLQNKLSLAEDELNTTRLKKLAAKVALLNTEKHLVTILQAGDATSISDVLEEVRAALNEVTSSETRKPTDLAAGPDRSCLETESAEVRDTRAWSPSDLSSCQSEEITFKQDIPLATVKVNSVGPELATAMHKVVSLVEVLSQVDYDVQNADADIIGDSSDSSGHDVPKLWRSSEFDSCVQSLITLCNGVLHGKVDIIDFLAEMASALDWLVSHIFSLPNKLLEANVIRRRRLDWDKGSVHPIDSQTVDTGTIFPTSVCKLSRFNDIDNTTEARSLSAGESTRNSEQESLSRSLDMHMKKIHSLEEQLSQLKSEKEEADDKSKLLTDELAALKSQLKELTLNASELQSSLTSALESKKSLVTDMADLVSLKSLLECQLSDAKDDTKKLEERALSLELQLQDEIQCRKDIEAMYQELLGRESCSTREMRQALMTGDEPNSPADEPALKTRKEHEIAAAAEKLAECQQTILALGKQLKDLGVPNEGDGTPALRFSSYRAPVTEHRSHSLSDQLPDVSGNNGSLYARVMESPSTSPIGFHQPIGEEESSLDHGRLHTDSLHGSQRGHNDGRHGGASYGGHSDGRHGGASYGTLLSPPDTSRGNVIVSPDYHESSSWRRTASSSPKDLALTSPARSPARFLSLKGRVWDSKPDGSSSEKHATGFSRFFSRNKTSRG